MFTRRHATALSAVALTTSVLFLAGCAGQSASTTGDSGSTPAAQPTGAPETTDITFGILPTPDYAPIQIALDKGFFEDEGLTVTPEVINPTAGLGPLLNQSTTVQGINWIQFVTSLSQNVPIVGIAGSDVGVPGYAEFMVKEDSPYQTMADLDGKKVAVVTTPGNCDLIPLAQLAEDGSSAKPNFVNLAIPDMPAQLASGGVDAACVPEPTLSALKAQGGFRSIGDLFTGSAEEFPVAGFSTSKAFADANPNTVAALQRALAKARAVAASDDAEVRAALKEFTKIPPAAIDTMILPKFVETITEDDLQHVVDVVKQSGLNPNASLPAGSIIPG
jgi:NitT/TauT family transport system substrate-binding protein